MSFTEEQIQSFQQMNPGDLIKLMEEDAEVKEYIYKNDFLMQTILIDNYDLYANNEKNKQLLEFENLSKSTAKQCVEEIYPELVNNYVETQRKQFPTSSQIFKPHLPLEKNIWNLYIAIAMMICYFIPKVKGLSRGVPLQLFMAYVKIVKTNFQPFEKVFQHADMNISKKLLHQFIHRYIRLVAFTLLPFLFLAVSIHPLTIILPIFVLPLIKKHAEQIIFIIIGYAIAIIPIILNWLDVISYIPLHVFDILIIIVFFVLQHYQFIKKPVKMDLKTRLCFDGVSVGAFIGAYYVFYSRPVIMKSIYIILMIIILLALFGFKEKKEEKSDEKVKKD